MALDLKDGNLRHSKKYPQFGILNYR